MATTSDLATNGSGETMSMWDSILAVVFSALLGLAGLGVAIWQVVTLSAVNSLDNIFVTLIGLLMAAIGFGYLAIILAPLFSKTDAKKK